MSLKHFYQPIIIAVWTVCACPIYALSPNDLLVIQTDFGVKDGAISAMKGVMYGVDKSLIINDLTQEIPAYNIWEASYRLFQTAPFWPKGTVFVSVVDPGVGTVRRSIVAESNNGYFFVTPDNGTLTWIDRYYGLKTIRQIDETKHRLPGSEYSHTFHGRDVYGYTAAKLASGKIKFEEVGPEINTSIVQLGYQKPTIKNNTIKGTAVVLDPAYGNVWTDINNPLLQAFGLEEGKYYQVKIVSGSVEKYRGEIVFQRTFGGVAKGKALLYINSLMNLAIGINQGNFATQHHIGTGPTWRIEISKIK